MALFLSEGTTLIQKVKDKGPVPRPHLSGSY